MRSHTGLNGVTDREIKKMVAKATAIAIISENSSVLTILILLIRNPKNPKDI